MIFGFLKLGNLDAVKISSGVKCRFLSKFQTLWSKTKIIESLQSSSDWCARFSRLEASIQLFSARFIFPSSPSSSFLPLCFEPKKLDAVVNINQDCKSISSSKWKSNKCLAFQLAFPVFSLKKSKFQFHTCSSLLLSNQSFHNWNVTNLLLHISLCFCQTEKCWVTWNTISHSWLSTFTPLKIVLIKNVVFRSVPLKGKKCKFWRENANFLDILLL